MLSQTRIIYFILCLTLSWATFTGKIYGQRIVKTEIDTHQIVLGDQINLKYSIERKEGQQVKFPVFSDTLVDGIEVMGFPELDSVKVENDVWKMSASFKITSFDTGIYYIPAQPVLIEGEENSEFVFSDATYLEVFGVDIDTTNTIRDIKGAESMPITFAEIAIYVFGLIAILTIAFFLYRYFKRKEEKTPLFKAVKPEEPPYISALRELDKIKVQKLWQQKKEKEYYSRITHVIRWYIERRFFVPALEQTSDEILHDLQEKNLDNVNFINLESLLNLADLVKFAKGEANPEKNIQHLDNAYDFVKLTKEVVQEASETEKTINN